MIGDFILRVDSAVGSAECLDSARCGKGSLASYGVASASGCSVSRMTNGDGKKGGEVVECRICQEEGDECDLESPCACAGTLKFAHRKCIQKWCNKKGNITCEICSQVFAPDYVSPSSEIGPDITTIDIRQSWSSQFDLRESHLFAISAAEQELLNADYENYAVAGSRGIAFCHTVALILMLLLFIRQVLNAMKEVGMMQGISSICDVSLQVAGLLLPCYVIARSCYIRRRQFAHRKCIQKWCNKKGNITCEICSQVSIKSDGVRVTFDRDMKEIMMSPNRVVSHVNSERL